MTDQELIAALRTRVAYHEREAERCRRMLALAEDDGPGTPARPQGARGGKRPAAGGKRTGKAGRVSNAPRPTQGKKPRVGQEIQRRLKAGEGVKAIARAVPCAPSTVSYHAKKLKLDPPA